MHATFKKLRNEFDQAQGLLDASESLVEERFSSDLNLLRARIYKDRGKMTEAIQVVEDLIAKNSSDERLFLVAGEYYHDAGKNTDAERALREGAGDRAAERVRVRKHGPAYAPATDVACASMPRRRYASSASAIRRSAFSSSRSPGRDRSMAA